MFFFNRTATTEIYTYGHTLSLHDARPISAAPSPPAITALEPAPIASIVPLLESTACAATPLRPNATAALNRSEEHTSELQSLMRISYAVFCLKKKKKKNKSTLKE